MARKQVENWIEGGHGFDRAFFVCAEHVSTARG